MRIYAPEMTRFEFFASSNDQTWHLRTWSAHGCQQHLTDIPLTVAPTLSKKSTEYWLEVPATGEEE